MKLIELNADLYTFSLNNIIYDPGTSWFGVS